MNRKTRFLRWIALGGVVLFSIFALPHAAQWLLSPIKEAEEVSIASQSPNALDSDNAIAAPASPSNSSNPANTPSAADPFRVWISEFSTLPADSPRRAESLKAGIDLAKARRPAMEKLIRENPRQAVAEALRFHEWAALPEEVKPEVERPFSAEADYSYLPICREPGSPRLPGEPDALTFIGLRDGTSLSVFSYGARESLMSKRPLPAQGVALGDIAALREETFQIVETAERSTVQSLFPAGQPDPQKSFASGEPIENEPLLALAGGRVFSFASEEEVQTLNRHFAEIDSLPGPYAAWGAVFASPADFETDNGGLNLPKIQAQATAQSNEWTLTKKRLFLIRINFPDRPEEPVTQAAAEAVMAEASERIREMSYGQTWVESAASASVYTMPQTFEYYSSSETRLWAELMRDARNTFRQSKSGLDSQIDIGPITTGEYNPFWRQYNLGQFNIVGIFRSRLTTPLGGAAGGSDLFMMQNDEAIYVHEWGHNYGLGHANLWKTTDGSVAGAGEDIEYGDLFDVMGKGAVPESHFHMQAKERLNWLPIEGWTDANNQESRTYRLYRIDSKDASGLRGLRMPRGGNGTANGYYWIGHRGAFADNPRMGGGAYIIWQRPGQARSWLLDTTPGSPAGVWDSALALGATFQDPLSQVFITPISKGGAGANSFVDIRVNIGPFPNNSAPQVGEISGPASVGARKLTTFSVTASDANGDQLVYSWDSGEKIQESHPLSSEFQCIWEVGGTYNLKVTVSDMKGGSVTKTRQIVVTDPLDHWETTNVGKSVNLTSAKSGNGLVVATGYWGEVFQSWDGISWQEFPSLPDFENPRLAFGGGRFVAVGKQKNHQKARIAFSHDGRLWEIAKIPESLPSLTVAYGGGKFVALGDLGSVLWSFDGVNWNAASVAGNPEFRTVAWNGTSWMAMTTNPQNGNAEIAWTSQDGISWTKGKNLGNSSAPLTGHNGAFYFNSWGNGIRKSQDGGSTLGRMPKLLGEDWWSARHVGISDGGVFLAHGVLPEDINAPLISTDGIVWHRSNSQSAAEAFASPIVWYNGKTWADQLVFGAGRFLRIGFDGVVKYSQPLSTSGSAPNISATNISGSGKSRRILSLSANATASNSASLRYFWDFGPNLPVLEGKTAEFLMPFGGTYNVTLRAMDPNGAFTTSNQTLTLSDSVLAFTKRESGATYYLAAIATNDTIAVAVGDANHAILTSHDGITWSKRTLPHRTYLHDITWDGTKFIVLGHSWRNSGNGGQWHNVIHTSPDGITWTERYLAPFSNNLHLRKLTAKPGGAAIAAGDQGLFLLSPDGFTWSPMSIPALGNHTVRDMEWSGREFLMVTDAFMPTSPAVKLLTSPDGLQWTDRTSAPLANSVWALARLKDSLYATGWTGFNTRIRISNDDGKSFFYSRLSDNVELSAMAYGGGIYFGVGVEKITGDPNIDVFSLNGNDWYSYESPTPVGRRAAVYFKNTFITVGEGGEIWQSDPFTPMQDILEISELGSVNWNGSSSEVRHKFLGLPGQRRKLQFTSDLAQPWVDHGVIEAGPLGTFEAVLRQSGDQRAKWDKRMFFRLFPAEE